MSTDDDRARASGFRDAADMEQYAKAMREQDLTERWTEAGAPSDLDMVDEIVQLRRRLEGKVPPPPLTVKEAARRLGRSEKYVRRRVNDWAAMTPPLAYRSGNGPRARWSILVAALDAPLPTVQPKPAAPPRGRRKTAPKVRSAGRWEV